jgi:hypothetical protein
MTFLSDLWTNFFNTLVAKGLRGVNQKLEEQFDEARTRRLR